MTTDPRIEAAAKALHHAEWIEGNFHETDAEHCWTLDPADHAGYYDQVRIVLAAADECDRVAGVVRVDLNDRQQVDALLTAYTDHSESYVIGCKDAEDGCFDCGEALAKIKAAILAAGVGEQQ